MVCDNLGCEIEYITLNFSANELFTDNCISEVRRIQNEQKQSLENWFRINKIDYKDQLLHCSSLDKIEKFLEFENLIESDKEYWEQLRECYINSDNNFRYLGEIKRLFNSKRNKREFIMSSAESEILNKLPNNITIYRGMTTIENESGDYGISWTLNEDIANSFARTFIRNYETNHMTHMVKKMTVEKRNIVAYFDERSEEEVIYIPQTN
jgi:hypothetical protein